MKKLLAIVLATVMVLSMFAVSASAFMDVAENFDSLPAGLEGREDVAIQTNKALKITPTAVEWGYKGIITFSDTLIDYDSTVSFYMMTNEYPDGWCHRLSLVLTDAIGKADESQTMGGVVTQSNQGRTPQSRALGFIQYNADADTPGTGIYYPGVTAGMEDQDYLEFVAGEWYRIDLLVDFANKVTKVYVNGALFGEANHSPNAVGYKGLKSYTISSGNYQQDFYVDELVVREGLVEPTEDDIVAAQDRDAIEASEEVVIYEPFDALNANTLSNTNKWQWTATEIEAFNQSTLSVTVPYGENAFEDVYLPLSEIALDGNATVAFKLMTQYTVKKLPGLEIKLVGADNAVIGGFIVAADSAKLMFDDGENVYAAKDADDAEIKFSSGKSYNITMLLNHANHSITLYIDDARIGTVAVEDDTLAGFTGILLTKQATTGSKPQTFVFDNLTAVEGLYVPGQAEALDENDELVQIDTKYVEPVITTTEAPVTTTKAPVTTTEAPVTTVAPSDVTDAPTTEAPKAQGGCGGVSLAAVVALAVGMFGIGFTVIKKK